jgi:DNA-nicking Smr family endonuclease
MPSSKPPAPRALAALADLGQLLAQRRREAEARAALEEAQLEGARREGELFAASVGQVIPLRKPAAPHPVRPRPAPHPQQREADEAAVLAESIADEFDAESLLETDDTLAFRRPDVGADVVRKLRRGVWALQAQLDLHGLRREQARERLGAFLRESARAGLRCVRVIHGKGNGSPRREPVLKGKVRHWLVQRDEVLAFTQARPVDGGAGAVIVLLKPQNGARVATRDD